MRYLILLIIALMPLPALAAAVPEKLGAFGFWQSYQVSEDNEPVCYMTLTAHPSMPAVPAYAAKGDKKTKRGDVVLMVTERPSENSLDVFSYNAGLKFRPASDVTATIGKKQFSLFTQGDTAWSRDPATDKALTAAILTGQSLTLSGTSARNTRVTDTIALKGALPAYRAIAKACGLPAPEEPVAAPVKKKKPVKH